MTIQSIESVIEAQIGAGLERLHSLVIAIVLVLGLQGSVLADSSTLDQLNDFRGLYAQLLAQSTTTVTNDPYLGVAVQYGRLATPKGTALRQEIRQSLEAIPAALSKTPETKAAWIDIYNFGAIDAVASNWPIASIRDLSFLSFAVWKKIEVNVGGQSYSLHQIEHEILRPMGDPLIHFALNCASRSCPDIARTPWLGRDSLAKDLAATATLFLQNSNKGLTRDQGQCRVSKIFDWFSDDFGGDDAVHAWIMESASTYRAPVTCNSWAWLGYDWSVNVAN